MRVLATACLVVALLGSCSGATTGELLSTPFPGSVLSASEANRGPCTPARCMATYRVRITNPTDGDANVQDCGLVLPLAGLGRLPVMGIAGLSVPSNTTRTVTATFLLPIGPQQIKALPGRELSCTGIDWHGHEPI